MKTYCSFQKQTLFMLLVMSIALAMITGCASQKKSTQADMKLPPIQTEPTVIELDNSNLSDALNEGDIPEENRDALSWLPNRPPQGMQFASTSELQTIYFEFDKFSLTSQAREVLNTNAAWLKNHPDVLVQLQGHCDERGTQEYNQALGENRAISVKKYLVTLGIDSERLFTISYGETMPADPNHTEDAWAKNRRAEFTISQ